ncbi:sensor histidine kinase [Paenibacillus hodogayensis]|uniref:Sensor histidine kinase n=1 Tax=Paenibacillus hodogayensis TaxID=279208 RepID=A0ABV5VZM4_9BACL
MLGNAFFKSIRFKLMFGVLIITVPLIGLLISNNLYAIQVVRNQVTQSNMNMLSLYMGQIDASLREVDHYLYALAAMDTDLLPLDKPDTGNTDAYNIAKIALSNKMTSDVHSYKSIDSFLIYSRVNDDMIMTDNMSLTYEYRKNMEGQIKQWLKTLEEERVYSDDRWHAYRMGDDYFLYHLVKAGQVYVGAWVNVNKIMVPLNLIHLGEQGRAILIDEADNAAMTDRDFVRQHGIDIANSPKPDADGHFLVVRTASERGAFSLAAIIPDSAILEQLPFFNYIIAFICIGAVIVIPIKLLSFRKMILLPVQRIMTAMKRVNIGQWETRIEPVPSSYEFELMHGTFNTMIATIQDLKISVYEEQISKQKAELMHLQLQINPHFFMNSMNIIYNSAQVHNYAVIPEMALALVNYFRYMLFQSNKTEVMLSDEIAQIGNYLRIQEMRYEDNLTYDISVPDELMSCLVPPLLIQTFVENTIKHAVTMDEPIHLDIVASYDPERTQMMLLIKDSGKGFSDDVLRKLSAEEDLINDQAEHLGIWNAKYRLRLLHGEKAAITFANGEEWGAEIRIVLPISG